MPTSKDPNVQAGAPTPVSTDDQAVVASADRIDGHYESSPDQVVKVVHQVRPQSLPHQGPTDFERHRGPQIDTVADVRVTPEEASVWEAAPRENPNEG